MNGLKRISLRTSLLCLPMLPFLSVQAEDNVEQLVKQEETAPQTVEQAAQDPKTLACLIDKLNKAGGQELVSKLRKECEVEINGPKDNSTKGAISKRFISESETKFDPYVITPHKMNYILPVSISDSMNRKTYAAQAPDSGWAENIEDYEAKYQLSIKVPLNYGDLFREGDSLYFGITIQSWWQLYSEGISKPFRETNYQPEVFYLTGLDWKPFDGNTGFMVGLEHQSNGRSTSISRSWNRVYLDLLWEKGNFALSFKPWYRLPEDDKEVMEDGSLDPDGDDNPDINEYMGYFSLGAVYKYNNLEFSLGVRENFATHKGGAEVGMTFPLWGKLRGYVQGFTGYGESLIDYNHKQNRIGVGIALTNIL
ncbi:phospholipase A [Thalassotalea psychrophila]|uniref:Phospholipase A1 n=1 Tax=Thalassotalea psychrophila TaxID=3065647 RepID=A0ABY9TYW0_9GAMM|nr:phospholipase A [Colwelliaceae bacterium SQ149]